MITVAALEKAGSLEMRSLGLKSKVREFVAIVKRL